MLRVLTDDGAGAEIRVGLEEIVREGARRMLAVALEAEVDDYVAGLVGEVDEHGHRLVTRNGHAERRTIITAAGGIKIAAPRVNDKHVDEVTGERLGFKRVIVAPWCRKSPKVAEVLPLMYLHGMSSGDFVYGWADGVHFNVHLQAAEQRWRSVNTPHLIALVRAGATFDKAVMIERPNQQDQEAAA
jgi:hypothetical protein